MITYHREEYTESDIIDAYLGMPMIDLLREYNVTEKAWRLMSEAWEVDTYAFQYLDWLVSAMQAIIADRYVVVMGLESDYDLNFN